MKNALKCLVFWEKINLVCVPINCINRLNKKNMLKILAYLIFLTIGLPKIEKHDIRTFRTSIMIAVSSFQPV